jgi:hypothetical protein
LAFSLASRKARRRKHVLTHLGGFALGVCDRLHAFLLRQTLPLGARDARGG